MEVTFNTRINQGKRDISKQFSTLGIGLDFSLHIDNISGKIDMTYTIDACQKIPKVDTLILQWALINIAEVLHERGIDINID